MIASKRQQQWWQQLIVALLLVTLAIALLFSTAGCERYAHPCDRQPESYKIEQVCAQLNMLQEQYDSIPNLEPYESTYERLHDSLYTELWDEVHYVRLRRLEEAATMEKDTTSVFRFAGVDSVEVR